MGILATLLDSIRTFLFCSTVAMVGGPVGGVGGTSGGTGGFSGGEPVGDPNGDLVGEPGGVGTDGDSVIGTTIPEGSVFGWYFLWGLRLLT